MIAYAYLALAGASALLTLNAHRPVRRVQSLLFPSFIAGWLGAELVAQHLALQVLVSGVFAYLGALHTWPGRLGLGLSLLSWAGMLSLLRASHGARAVLERALRDDLAARGVALVEARRAPHRPLWPFGRSDPAVTVHLDLRYAEGAGRRHLLDVYTSKTKRANAPVLLQVHGGGWFTGHKRQQALPLMLHMARHGWVCVAPNYRLSPRATWPEHLHDIKLALAWVRHNIARYGGDPDYVAITGGSAGGHLAAMMALTPNAPEHQPGFAQVDTRVRACVPFYGVYDFLDRNHQQAHPGMLRLLSRVVLKKRFEDDPAAYDAASPLSHVGAHAPPFFVIHGTHDNLVPVADARAFVERLRASGTQPVVYAELPGAHHAFEIFHSIRTASAVEAVACFLLSVHARDRSASEAGASAQPGGVRVFDEGASAPLP